MVLWTNVTTKTAAYAARYENILCWMHQMFNHKIIHGKFSKQNQLKASFVLPNEYLLKVFNTFNGKRKMCIWQRSVWKKKDTKWTTQLWKVLQWKQKDSLILWCVSRCMWNKSTIRKSTFPSTFFLSLPIYLRNCVSMLYSVLYMFPSMDAVVVWWKLAAENVVIGKWFIVRAIKCERKRSERETRAIEIEKYKQKQRMLYIRVQEIKKIE